jgi:hypothetical protein
MEEEAEAMMIPRISLETEKPFRKALGHAIRNELEEMHEGLLRLSDEQIVACLNLCALVAGYVAIDACGRQWPDEDNLRGIGEVPTESENARASGLRAEDSYAYVKRVALGAEQLDAVLSPVEDAATFSFVITGHLLVAFSKPEEDWWEYLDRIEAATEAALAADLDLLPALMLRWRRLAAAGVPQR